MTKITWKAFDPEARQITLQAEGVKLEIVMHEEGRVYYMTDGDRDYAPEDQTLAGIFLKISDEYVSLRQIVDAAENDFDELVEEAETENGYEAAYQSDASSLEYYGRA